MYKKSKFLIILFLIIFNSGYADCSKFCDLKQNSNESSFYYEYDNFDRVISKNYSDGKRIQYRYDNIGNCTQVIDDDKTTFYEYDIFDNISKITFPNFDSLQYLYDAFGKLLKITYPDNFEVYYSYDLSDRLVEVKDSSGTSRYEYDEKLNKVKKIVLPNGVFTEVKYNGSRRISDVIHKNKDGTLIEKYQYKYDPNGNRIQIDKISSKTTSSVFYKYDSLNRVIEAKYSNGFFESFTYDKKGNCLSKSNPNETILYEYSLEGVLLKAGDIEFFYDKEGNLIKKSSPDNVATYTYNADNLLVSYIDNFNKIEFEYDVFGNRISKIVNGNKTDYINDLSSPIAQVLFKRVHENSGEKEKIIKYTYGSSRLNQSCNEKIQFYLYDSIGRNVSSLIDDSGQVLNSYEYEAFGNRTLTNSNIKNDYQFCAEQFDEETGLIYLRNRYYDPSLGRFITKDKTLGDLKNPQTLNKYVYVANNPINYIDPLGFASISPEEKELVILHVNYRCGYLGGQGMGGHAWLEFPAKNLCKGNYPGGMLESDYINITPSTFSMGCYCDSNKVNESIMIMDNIDWTISKNCVYTAVEGMKAMEFKHAEKLEFPLFGAMPMPKALKEQMFKFYKKDKEGLILYVHEKPSALKTFFSPAYRDAIDYGGVSLSKKAEMQLNILDIKGAIFDKITGQIILFGEEQHFLPKVNIDDLAVAVKSIYGIGLDSCKDPGVSIGTEVSDKPGQMKVRYDGATENTSFGNVMFEADRLLKSLTLGIDNCTGTSFKSHVHGYLSLHDRLGRNCEGHFENRMWFVPQKISLIESEDGKSVMFDDVKMQVLTEAQMDGQKTDFAPCIDFAKHFTDHYDEYAKEFPVLKDLKDLGKITAIVKWLKDNQIPFDISFFINYQPKYVQTPQYTPEAKRVTTWPTIGEIKNGAFYLHEHCITTTGGVVYRLDQKNFSLQKNYLVGQFSLAALQTRPTENDFKWSFHSPVNYDQLLAVAHSIYRTKKPGNIKKYYLDMSISISQDARLELGRFYNSFCEESSYLGYGWKILPYEMKFSLKKITVQVQNIQISTFSHILLRVFDTEDFYELVELKEGFPIFKSKGSQYYLKDNLDGTFTLHFLNDQILAVFDNFGRITQTLHEDVSIFYEYDSGRLVKISSSKGHNICFDYDHNKILAANSSDGKVIYFAYNACGLLAKVTNMSDQSTEYFYDKDQRLNQVVVDQNNIVFTAVYDDYNRVTKTYENGKEYSFEYSLEERFMKTKNHLGEEIIMKFNEENKIIEQREGEKKIVYVYELENCPLPTKIIDNNGFVLEIKYNANNQITFFKNAFGLDWEFYYDQKGNLLIEKHPNGRFIVYGYDSKSNLKQVALNAKVTFSADKMNFNYTTDGGSILIYNYDPNTNKLMSMNRLNGSTYSFGYDENGYLNRIRTPTGYTLEKTMDFEGKLLEIKDGYGVVMSYEYDENGYLKKVVSQEGIKCFSYDNGNLIETIDLSESVVKYEYDIFDNLKKVVDSKGSIFNYRYAENNRLSSIEFPDSYVENF